MSEEEKEAIDYLKNDVVYWLDKGKDFVVIDIGENEKLHNILNLIDKQQKEIEKLNFENHMVKKWNKQLDQNYISKEKIKEFIKKDLPDDEFMKWNIIYDVNGIDLRIKLEKMLEEN